MLKNSFRVGPTSATTMATVGAQREVALPKTIQAKSSEFWDELVEASYQSTRCITQDTSVPDWMKGLGALEHKHKSLLVGKRILFLWAMAQ